MIKTKLPHTVVLVGSPKGWFLPPVKLDNDKLWLKVSLEIRKEGKREGMGRERGERERGRKIIIIIVNYSFLCECTVM